MSVDYDKVKKIFLDAVKLHGVKEQKAFIEEACGTDIDLRNFIMGMHEAHQQIATPIPDGPTVFDAQAHAGAKPALEIGSILDGTYKIIELIDEGGMGCVYRASRVTDMKMEVAIKVIKPGMDSQQVLARFNIERQALALMKHENIARVLDAGMTDQRLPYFVMELVKGLNLTRFCNESRLSINERLELFEQICSAIQHAHQKGIVHRDLKPNNILVALFDDKPVPKVIDFGLAKAMYQPLTDDDLRTKFGTFVGTWQYTAPEQAQLNNLDVDTRADIYSLGVILYELLTGSTPLEKKRLIHAAYEEVLRIIREEEPPKPSTKVHSSEQLPSIAAQRHTEPLKLERQIRGELDWIVMKALDKDRNRRYATANEFGRDINAYLHAETVSAVPPSLGYKLSRFYRKHRGAILVAASLLLIFLAGLITSIIGFVKASKAEQQALQELNTVKSLLNFIEGDLFAGMDPIERGKMGLPLDDNISLKQILDNSAANVSKGSLADHPLVEARIRNTLGKAYYAIGKYKEAEGLLKQAEAGLQKISAEESPEKFAIKENLGNVMLGLGNLQEASVCFDEVRQYARRTEGVDGRKSILMDLKQCMIDKIGEKTPEELSQIGKKLEQVAEASRRNKHFDLMVKASMNLAEVKEKQGEKDASLTLHENTVVQSRELLSADHPSTLAVMNNLGAIYQDRGMFKKAQTVHEETIQRASRVFSPDHPVTALYKSNLASSLLSQGRVKEAETHFREALEVFQRVTPAHRTTLTIKMNIASLWLKTKDYPAAVLILAEAKSLVLDKFGVKSERSYRMLRDYARALVGIKKDEEALAELKHLSRLLIENQSTSSVTLLQGLSSIRDIMQDQGRLDSFEKLKLKLVEYIATLPQGKERLLKDLKSLQ